MTPALDAHNLERAYASAGTRARRTLALREFSCSIGAGEFVGLLGPNGAGKTTFLRCAAGLLRPDRGDIRWFGRPLPKGLPRGVALVNDAPAYYRFLSVREAVEHYAVLHDIPAADRGGAVEAMLEQVGLTPHADKRIGELSRGMTQRIGIAQALIGRPKLLLLDETLGGLDPITRRAVRELLRQVARNGCAIVLSTHDVATLEHLADRVLVQHEGRIAGELDPRSLTWARWLVLEAANPHETLAHLAARAAAPGDAAAELGTLRPVPGGVAIALDGRTPEAVLAAVRAAGVAPAGTRLDVDDLEARYLEIVARVTQDATHPHRPEVA
jgi:ABC-2 type transport system ATP-binding protein